LRHGLEIIKFHKTVESYGLIPRDYDPFKGSELERFSKRAY